MNNNEYTGYHLQNLTVNRKKACATYNIYIYRYTCIASQIKKLIRKRSAFVILTFDVLLTTGKQITINDTTHK